MQTWSRSPRNLLPLALIVGLCAGLFAPRWDEVVSAQPAAEVAQPAPLHAVDELNVVISEFRFVGPEGGNDEFIELFNPSWEPITITGWKIWGSNSAGSIGNTPRFTFTETTILQPGQYYLLVNSGASESLVSIANKTYTSGFTEDGGVALTLPDNTVIDQVGLSSGSTYKEGTPLAPLTGSSEQSYERKRDGTAGNCFDTDNNAADFVRNNGSSNPRNSFQAFAPCLVVTNVTSAVDDTSPFQMGDIIDITVTFSSNVNVTGSPRLKLETGATDRDAIYLSGSGTNTLIFRYTVQAGDSSSDLAYVSANALTLNGGTIIGAIGDAVLILPKPGASGSLSANKAIQIDSDGPPTVLSITRLNPTAQITNSDTLTFRVTFSEAVNNVSMDGTDFETDIALSATIGVTQVTGNRYDVTLSGGNIPTYNGNVGLALSGLQDIEDLVGNDLVIAPIPTNETYTLDNTPPNVTISLAGGQSDTPNTQPIQFVVQFDEPIDVSTFSTADITQSGTSLSPSWTITNTGDNQTFNLSATVTSNGTVIPSISANQVNDLAGNGNTASTNTTATLFDNISPTVTINQLPSQPDPANSLPVRFRVVFSEPINTAFFTTADITQNGTATGVVWSIANPSGDRMTFNLNATSVTGQGTIIPTIAANRVTDLVGNNNLQSTSTDNSVLYQIIVHNTRAVLINEVAWAGTGSGLSEHEWIELYNPGNTAINITGWKIVSADGNPNITLNGVIPAKGYFLLERGTDNVVANIAADQVYPGAGTTNSLSNSGETLYLRDVSNKTIDTANINGGAWPRGSSSTYATMERSGNIADSDSAWHTNTGLKRNGKNANGGNIMGTPKSANSTAPTPTPTRTPTKTRTPTPIRTTTPTRTPTRTPTPPPASLTARLVINEILARPGFDWNRDGVVDVYDEFIEIKNNSTFDVDLRGWKLDDQASNDVSPFNLPNQTLRPGERVAFFRPQTNIPLSDGGGTVRLLNSQNLVFDEFTYVIAKAEDRSFCRIPDGGFSVLAWQEDCIPTPNLPNTLEGSVPSLPGGFDSPVCDLPDTIPAGFFSAECRGYGANIWNPYYWDQAGWAGRKYLPQADKKWQSFIE